MTHPIVCFSHLRWDFVYQRPNHLMERAGRDRRVYFVEEPELVDDLCSPELDISRRDRVSVVGLRLPATVACEERAGVQAALVERLVRSERLVEPVAWYYTPMALPWTEGLATAAVVYDCMDQLSAFRGAPRALLDLEAQLLARADLVFTGGRQLHEEKRLLHGQTHLFPSSVDRQHFLAARAIADDPADQAAIPRPRLGYFGVIDERIDLGLLREVARRRADWHLVLVGPTAKVDRADVPDGSNVHLLGMKRYAELPRYLAGWDVALMPFAHNESTRFISPTKTPEYLAGGKPVVSTSIADVVHPYGVEGLARIADGPDAFIAAIDEALSGPPLDLERVDAFLAKTSWDRTWSEMSELLDAAIARRTRIEAGAATVAGDRDPFAASTAGRLARAGARRA